MKSIKRQIILWISISSFYFAWFVFLVGFRPEHLYLWALSALFWFWNSRTKTFIRNISVWLIYWLIYDSLRIIPNWKVNGVHIEDLYQFEKHWFGIDTAGGLMTMNEWCMANATTTLDLLSAAFYLSWVPLPVMFAVWLYWRNKELFLSFSWCFLLVNIIGFSIYYIYPAAPPWYVAEHGFEFNPDAARSAAGLNRVDEYLNMDLFHRIYSRNSNVFAAMPSLHSAYPLVAWFYARKSKHPVWFLLFSITSVGIWTAAIYTAHHYVMDVLIGILVAITGHYIYEKYAKSKIEPWIIKRRKAHLRVEE